MTGMCANRLLSILISHGGPPSQPHALDQFLPIVTRPHDRSYFDNFRDAVLICLFATFMGDQFETVGLVLCQF